MINYLIKPASSACNLQCGYCFYADVAAHRAVKSYGIMTPETTEDLIRCAFTENGDISFAFQGGEPTVAGLEFFKNFVELVNRYNKKNVKVWYSIQTNGFAVDEEFADFFAENKFLVGISLDGPREIHDRYRMSKSGGTFDAVMSAISLLTKAGAEFNILCVVTEHAAKNAKRIWDFYTESGFKFLQFIPCIDGFDQSGEEYSLTPASFGQFLKDIFDKYYNAWRHDRYISVRDLDNFVAMLAGGNPESCGLAGRCSANATVEGDGNVYPCDFYVLDKYRLGNVKTNRMINMLTGDIARQFVTESLTVHDKCRVCKYDKLCRGGCRRLRNIPPDDNVRADGKAGLYKLCEAYKTFFAYAMPRMEKMALAFKKSKRQEF